MLNMDSFPRHYLLEAYLGVISDRKLDLSKYKDNIFEKKISSIKILKKIKQIFDFQDKEFIEVLVY